MTAEAKERSNEAKPGVIGSIIDLGTATTKLTIDHVQNAFTALKNPGAAIEHVKETMQNLSEAMNTSAAGHKFEPAESDLRGASTGRQHLAPDAEAAHAHTAPAHHAGKSSAVKKMNRRKS